MALLTPASIHGTSPIESAITADDFGASVEATLAWCVEVGRTAPVIGTGRTRELWELLATTAEIDVAAARMLEPHLDALAILQQAGVPVESGSSWGVFAAEAPEMRLTAERSGTRWILRGIKPWCSLAANLSHALVAAHVGDAQRGLFAVDLRAPGVHPHTGPWFARGLPQVVSAPVEFDGVAAAPVGDPGWYLSRPGFAWGGMSVATCWWGAALALLHPLTVAARREHADQLAAVHLGRADAALWGARAVLAEAADLIDGDAPFDERLLAERVRAVVMDATTLVLAEADAALGPAPLVTDLAHARRVADLHLYLRQHHGPRDLARIGRSLAGARG